MFMAFNAAIAITTMPNSCSFHYLADNADVQMFILIILANRLCDDSRIGKAYQEI